MTHVVKVLECRNLSKQNTMRDGLGGEEGGCQVVRIACFTCVRSKDKSVWKERIEAISFDAVRWSTW